MCLSRHIFSKRLRSCCKETTDIAAEFEIFVIVEWHVFGRAASRRCRPRRSPVIRGTRLRRLPVLLCPLKLFLQVCELLLEGGHVGGGGLLVFGDVVVFGMVVFGVLIVVAGFFIRVFIS